MGASLASSHGAPWQGEVAKLPATAEPAYDPNCYLCPGNTRAGGIHNPAYSTTFVFENDFAALKRKPLTLVWTFDHMGLLGR